MSEEGAEDEEQARRRTIAERMARLGGLKMGFGGAPPPIRKVEKPAGDKEVSEVTGTSPAVAGPETEENEEDERARRERIRAKLSGMGGVGMFGPPPIALRPAPTKAQNEDHVAPPQQSEEPLIAQEDEVTEVGELADAGDNAAEARVEVEAEAIEEPPPVPSRVDRRASAAPIQTDRLHPVPALDSSTGRPTSAVGLTPTEYVMVEPASAYEENVRPPPPRPFRAPPPPRIVPTPPTSPPPTQASQPLPPTHAPPSGQVANAPAPENQWELPTIPSGGLELGAASGVSSVLSPDIPAKPLREPVLEVPSSAHVAEATLSSDELMAIWGRVGVHVIHSATELAEKSKKSIVGDGSFSGFVDAVLHGVPNARIPAPGPIPVYGHIIYMQSGATVQRRVTDIMPGDVITLSDAKLKGHKGLQTYHQHVGEQEPCVGIISDFEPKKAKVKVLQASKQVGHQTVETVSYRLEDLKSGTVKASTRFSFSILLVANWIQRYIACWSHSSNS
jgi:myosin tail region-interacting protein MTI1